MFGTKVHPPPRLQSTRLASLLSRPSGDIVAHTWQELRPASACVKPWPALQAAPHIVPLKTTPCYKRLSPTVPLSRVRQKIAREARSTHAPDASHTPDSRGDCLERGRTAAVLRQRVCANRESLDTFLAGCRARERSGPLALHLAIARRITREHVGSFRDAGRLCLVQGSFILLRCVFAEKLASVGAHPLRAIMLARGPYTPFRERGRHQEPALKGLLSPRTS